MRAICLLSVLIICAFAQPSMAQKKHYKDGSYYGESRARYVNEPYYGQAKIVVKKEKIVSIEFRILDKEKNVEFDKEYAKYFKGNDEYVQQCINDWNGLQAYMKMLRKKQSLEGVDAVSGATWSYEIFKASVEEALKKAEK